jgi:endonuclease-3
MIPKKDIPEIFRRLREKWPDPRPTLVFRNNFELICAVLLSAQTTDTAVNRVTPALFAMAPDPDTMRRLDPEVIAGIIASIGLYRNKTKHLQKLSEALMERFQGEVPEAEEDLISLPGVGRKTARVVENIAFGKGTVAVDTHIFRVNSRLKLVPGKTPEAVSDSLPGIIPPEYLRNAHHWLIYLGRHICRARKPLCGECPVASFCRSRDKTRDESGPGDPAAQDK